MFNLKILKVLLLPFSLLYGIVVGIRNFFYKEGILKSVKFSVPVISIGNLSVGGTGKTPHVAYLIAMLQQYVQVAIMSRGYKRKTRGFRMVGYKDTIEESGDEPLLLKYKFPHLPVSVSEDRALGIPKLLGQSGQTQVIILDDAFQHRSVDPELCILLTDYSKLFTRDWLLPSGRLREWPSAYKRSDLIVVTKCPDHMTSSEADAIIEEIQPGSRPVFFSRYVYGNPYFILNYRYVVRFEKSVKVILMSAIAGTDYLLDYLDPLVDEVFNLEFEDHHNFSEREIMQIVKMYENLEAEKKVVICTEKDAVRLVKHKELIKENKLPIFVLPIAVEFLFDKKESFDNEVKRRLLDFKV
jgi:tetraacyldisaccharide 4'-kinase